MRFLLLIGSLAACVPVPIVDAKPKPPFHLGYAFSKQGQEIGSSADVGVLVSFDRPWDRVEITATVESLNSAEGDAAGKPNPVTVTPSETVARAKGELEETDVRGQYKIPLVFKVSREGEYLVKLAVRFSEQDRPVGNHAGQFGIYAAAGKIWLGPESPEQALLQSFKAELGIKGEPSGAALQRLNRKWAAWIEARQKRDNQRRAGGNPATNSK